MQHRARRRDVAMRCTLLILCCPCVFIYAYHIFRRSRRPTRHPCLIVAPAPPPAYLLLPNGGIPWDPILDHLKNPGNRVFHLRPDHGQLTSGNLAAVCQNVFDIVGEPKLLTTVSHTRWREVLGLFKGVRESLNEKGEWGWEKKWVEGSCAALEKVCWDVGEKEGESRFEIWKVEVQTDRLACVVEERCVGAEIGFTGQSTNGKSRFMWTTRTFIPPDFGPGALYNPNGRTVQDLFEGNWTENYLVGGGEPMRVDSGWMRVFEPRRSLDSGILEAVVNEDGEDSDG